MNQERLDQILVRLGFATTTQVEQALRQQQGLGGRLGTHLVYAGHVTEDQLARALSLQFGVPAFDANRHRPSRALLERLPAGFARQHQVLPLALDDQTGTLALAAVDPRDTTAIGEVRRVLRCRAVTLCVIPEVTFERVLAGVGEDGGLFGTRRLIELPELFEDGRAAEAAADVLAPAAQAAASVTAGAGAPRVLLVTERAFLRSFLAPLLEREGRPVAAAGDATEAAAALAVGDIAHVLVSAELEDGWRDWLRRGLVAAPGATVTRLGPVGEVLLETAAPYAAMQQCLLRALRLHAESAGDTQAVPPPYDLLRRDVRGLGAAAGLDRLALDALEAAVLLLAPAAPPAADVSALLADDGTGIDWTRTLADAAALAFPWPLEAALAAMRQLLSERVNLDEFGRHEPELALAAQVLALVWHHHQRATGNAAGDGRRALAARAALRARGGQLARAELVERYVAWLERGEDDLAAAAGHQLLVVGPADRTSRQLAARLGHLGYRVHALTDLEETAALCERQAPAAVLIYDAGGQRDLAGAVTRLRGGSRLLVCAVTTLADPAHVLNLFDAGFDDVFALPRDLDLIPARLRKALRAGGEAPAPAPARPGCFQAAFSAFAFTDLMQTLSQSLKSVRISLSRDDGETAVVYLDRGQLTHAACGTLQGGEAVYRVIAWEDDGRFAVEPATEFPEPNIGLPLESILMEGCRLLDESRL